MSFYNPIDKEDVNRVVKELKESGFIVDISYFEGTIKRETSKYNKYMKWHAELFREDNSRLASNYFKSKPDALRHLSNNRAIPVGDNRMLVSYINLI